MKKIMLLLNLIAYINNLNGDLSYLLVGILFILSLISLLLYMNFKILKNTGDREKLFKKYTSKKKLKEAYESLNESNILLSAILESSPEIIVFALDREFNYISFNERHKETMKQIWGKDIEVGMNMLEIIKRDDDYLRSKENFERALAGESFALVEEYGDEKLARLTWQNYYAPIYLDSKEIVGLTCFVIDITDRKKAEERIIYLSYHDELTGLYNRRFFEKELRRLDLKENLPISIIVGDINGLKLTNDIFGHSVGDLLLQNTAVILKKTCREEDVIARVGGDEFTILLPRADQEETERIIKAIKNELLRGNIQGIRTSMSMGYHIKNSMEEDILQTLKIAGDKMYSAKTLSQNTTKGITIDTVINALHENSPRERDHSKTVSQLCENMGKLMGLCENQVKRLRDAGFLHDIGKVILDKEMLNRDRVLSLEELNQIKRHPVVGYRILNFFDDTLDLAELVLSHHEKWDGTGYPKGLKGDEIPKLARIISLVGHYDSLVNTEQVGKEEAIENLKNQAGTMFDPELVDMFIKMLEGNN